MKKGLLWIFLILLLGIGAYQGTKYLYKNKDYSFGQAIDSLNNVKVYYNGSTSTVNGRTVVDGYNVGLKYQCVEFVKRYYFEHFNHRMPNSYGHAKSFFNPILKDGDLNADRGLIQFSNPSEFPPQVGDLIVMGGGSYGHVAIVSQVSGDDNIEIIQQNPGQFGDSRIRINLKRQGDLKWYIDKSRILGWLRKN